MMPWQAVGDCVWCQVEGATTELIDPAHPSFQYGRATLSSCNLCGRTETWENLVPDRCRACQRSLTAETRERHACVHCGDTPEPTVEPGIDLQDEAAVRAALARWAEQEGLSADELCSGSLGIGQDAVVAALAAGKPVSSSLHAIAFLFPGMAAGGSAAAETELVADVAPTPAPVVPPPDVFAPARLLVSVMLADGAIVAGEQSFVERFLEKHGLPGLQPEDLRPWRPHEVGRIESDELARAALEAAVELMHLDGSSDGSELRIIRTFARVWGVPETQIQAWNRVQERRHARPLSRVWRTFTRFVS